jgi:peptide/nickel transport system substrate-binding protein
MVARWFAGLLLLVAGVAGCAPAPLPRHELRLSLALDPLSLSPLYAFAQDQIALDLLWCQTLVGLDEHNAVVPVLVTQVPSRANGGISADGLKITYHLRPGVRFADGTAFTSADVAFTYRAILDPANAASTLDDYLRIAALTTPDARTVVIRLRSRWAAAVNVLFAQADEAYGILPSRAFTGSKIAGSAWAERPFGTGPFRVTAWQRGDRIVLEPNPYFSPAPKLRRIVVRIVPDQTTAFNALQTQAVDVAVLNPDNVAPARALPAMRIERTPENGEASLYLQTAAGPTRDISVRRAIARALDVRALQTAWRGVFPPAHSVFPDPLISWRAAPPAPFRYDPAAAGRDLEAAGWHLNGKLRARNGVPLELVIVCDASRPTFGRIAVVVQQQLAAIGAEATIKAYAPAMLSAPDGPERNGRFNILVGSYVGGSDPEQSLALTCGQAQSASGNYSRYCSPAFDRLFAQQRSELDAAARRREIDELARVVRADIPLIPLYGFVNIEGVNARVTGYARNMLRFPVRAEVWDAL